MKVILTLRRDASSATKRKGKTLRPQVDAVTMATLLLRSSAPLPYYFYLTVLTTVCSSCCRRCRPVRLDALRRFFPFLDATRRVVVVVLVVVLVVVAVSKNTSYLRVTVRRGRPLTAVSRLVSFVVVVVVLFDSTLRDALSFS